MPGPGDIFDQKVLIVTDEDEADAKVLVVEGGAAVPVDMSEAQPGQIVVVGEDGSLIPISGNSKRLLGRVRYNPAATPTISSTSNVWGAVDAVNLPAVPFTVPDNGAVEVEFDAYVQAIRTASLTALQFAVLQGGSPVDDSVMHVISSNDNGIDIAARTRCGVIVDDLTPGAELSWTWAFRRGLGDGAANIFLGGTDGQGLGKFGPARMSIWTVPDPLGS